MTNYEKIKAMSVEEMAEFLGSIYIDVNDEQPIFSYSFYSNDGTEITVDFEDWLESEAEEDE